MNAGSDTLEEREVRSIARRYKRKGYVVSIPSQGAAVPEFLAGLAPDLIAQSEDDRVVVEVKRRQGLLASNEIQEVAERVSREPGWRFELVTVRSDEPLLALSADRIENIENRVRQLISLDLKDFAYLSVWAVIEVLLSDLASQNGLRVNRSDVLGWARDLSFNGIISADILGTIERARRLRNEVVHEAKNAPPSEREIEELLALARELRDELAHPTQ
jgi:REase_AHJR-like